MNTLQAIRAASQSPEVARAVDLILQQAGDMPITADGLDELIKMLEFALQKPEAWPQIREAAIKDKLADSEDLPQRFDAQVIMSLLATMYELQRRVPKEEMAQGGLSRAAQRIAAAGRGPDTTLAHVTPAEVSALRRMGGSGTINPRTGLPEFGWFSNLVKIALPVVLDLVAPGLGTTIGTSILGASASTAAATALGTAIIGGVTSGLTGGNVLQGALLGGLSGGFGSMVGGGVNEALGLGLGQTGQNMLGGALLGGVAGAATGQGFGKGALMGAAGAGLGAATQGVGEGAVGAGIGSAGRAAGNMLTAGFNPREALLGGALSGLATGLTYKPPAAMSSGLGMQKPSDVVVDTLKTPNASPTELDLGGYKQNYLTGKMEYSPPSGAGVNYALTSPAAPGVAGADLAGQGLQMKPGMLAPNVGTSPGVTGAAPTTASSSSPFSLKNLGTLALLGSMAGSRPPAVNQAISTLSPAQQEYFNRPSVKWDWDKLQNDANAMNVSLSQYMAMYWPRITSGSYNVAAEPPKMATGGMYAMGGGPLGAVARLARGAGSGRDDTIDARLSDGEYVMDAETVAMLGDGSTEEGARRLDSMRAQLRKHKGKQLAKGKFSPNAKSPLAYIKGAA